MVAAAAVEEGILAVDETDPAEEPTEIKPRPGARIEILPTTISRKNDGSYLCYYKRCADPAHPEDLSWRNRRGQVP